MTGPGAFGVSDAPNPWVVCWSCKGESWVDTCLADPCPHQPPCPKRRCLICGGNGGWNRAEEAAGNRLDRAIHNAFPEPAP